MIGDTDLKISKLYGMLQPERERHASQYDSAKVFVVGPDKKVKLMIVYPMSTGRNFDEVLRVIDQPAIDREIQRRDARQLEGRRRLHHRAGGFGRGCKGEIPRRLERQ